MTFVRHLFNWVLQQGTAEVWNHDGNRIFQPNQSCSDLRKCSMGKLFRCHAGSWPSLPRICLFLTQLMPMAIVQGAVEQRLIIDFGKHGGEETTRYGGSTRSGLHRFQTENGLPDSVDELKSYIRGVEKLMTERMASLSRRVERLETSQNRFHQSQMAEWSALSTDKRVRPFTHVTGTFREAEQICKIYSGTLLLIDSEEENARTGELLQNLSAAEGKQTLYWIGAQAIATYSIPSPGVYHNFDEAKPQSSNESVAANFADNARHEMRGCAAISAQSHGKWLSRECTERHNFICQS